MRIVLREPDRLVLAGVPGGIGWMIVAVVLGGIGTAAAIYGLLDGFRDGRWFGLIFIGLGLLVAQAIFWMGALTLAVGRERLELDRRTGRGRYAVRSPIVETGNRSFEFDLADVASVTIAHEIECVPGITAAGHGSTREREVQRVRLQIGGSRRRAVTLGESSADDKSQLESLAREVADFLSVEAMDLQARAADEEPDARTGAINNRSGTAETNGIAPDFQATVLPPQPEPAEWLVTPSPDGSRMEMARIKRGGPPVFGLFLLLLTLFGVITLIFAIGVWVTETASDGRPLTDLERIGLTLPGLVAIIVIPWSWISLLRGRRCIVIEADALTARWDYPGRAVVACVPGLRRVFARGERVAIGPTGERPAVRIIRAPEGRVIEVRAGGRRARIGSDAPSQEAEDAALKWLARVLRMLIGKIGSG